MEEDWRGKYVVKPSPGSLSLPDFKIFGLFFFRPYTVEFRYLESRDIELVNLRPRSE